MQGQTFSEERPPRIVYPLPGESSSCVGLFWWEANWATCQGMEDSTKINGVTSGELFEASVLRTFAESVEINTYRFSLLPGPPNV